MNGEYTFIYDGRVIQESEDPILIVDGNSIGKSTLVDVLGYGLMLSKYFFGVLYLCNPHY